MSGQSTSDTRTRGQILEEVAVSLACSVLVEGEFGPDTPYSVGQWAADEATKIVNAAYGKPVES